MRCHWLWVTYWNLEMKAGVVGWTYERWSKSSMDTFGRTVTLFTSLWSPSNKKRRNSWASCWLQKDKKTDIIQNVPPGSEERWAGGGAYLQPTNLGAYFWIWLLKSEGLMASWFTDVHRLWVSFANSETTGRGRRNNERKLDHNDVWRASATTKWTEWLCTETLVLLHSLCCQS